jgi:hypothetical protein
VENATQPTHIAHYSDVLALESGHLRLVHVDSVPIGLVAVHSAGIHSDRCCIVPLVVDLYAFYSGCPGCSGKALGAAEQQRTS